MRSRYGLVGELFLPWFIVFLLLSVVIAVATYWQPLIVGFSSLSNVAVDDSTLVVGMKLTSSLQQIGNLQAQLAGPILVIVAAVASLFIWRSTYHSIELGSEVKGATDDSRVATNYLSLIVKIIFDTLMYCLFIVMWSTAFVVIIPTLFTMPLEGLLKTNPDFFAILQVISVVLISALIMQALWTITVAGYRYSNA